MRFLVDSLIAILLVATLALVLVHYRQAARLQGQQQQVLEALDQLHEQAAYHGALQQAHEAGPTPGRRSGLSFEPRPDWFGSVLPVNSLVPMTQPWMDLAPHGDRQLHPPDPVLEDSVQGGFWYNPLEGVFRARVPRQATDRQTLDLYNRINGTALAALPADADLRRRPIAYAPPARTGGASEDVQWASPVLPEVTSEIRMETEALSGRSGAR